MISKMLALYPELEPFRHFYVSRAFNGQNRSHQIYVEQCGNPDGIPILFLHGGPGSGCKPQHRRYFNPEHYHIILFDQRGCARSHPLGSIEQNTTQDLIADIEALRKHLSIERWMLFGGSWGATLALLYAQEYPKQVLAMILRGIFLGRQQDIDWAYSKEGAAKVFPDAWHQLVAALPREEQKSPLSGLYGQLNSEDSILRLDAQQRLHYWESAIVSMRAQPCNGEFVHTDESLASTRIQLHYSLNQCFIEENSILDNIEAIRTIPTDIIHGRYDMVCPLAQAWALSQAWPEAKLNIVEMAGHVASEPALIDALVKSTRRMASRLNRFRIDN